MRHFELLPNEIFLDLFDYLDGTDLLHAFYGLNFRFKCLLYKQYRAFRFNFQSISKRQFDMICEQHFPFIVDRVRTLCLSNGDSTPPDTFRFSNHYVPTSFLSTNPNDDLQRFSNDITKIFNEKLFDFPIPSYVRFTNLEHLQIKFPIPDQFWSIVSNLNRLHTLAVYVNTNTSQSQLQKLLDLAPHLYKLNIWGKGSVFSLSLEPWQMAFLRCLNTSVRHLDLHQFALFSIEEECLILSRSTLSAQCEVLSIQVNSYEHILSLVYNMKNLRALVVYYGSHLSRNYSSLTESSDKNFNHDEIIQWLKEHLPSTYAIDKVPGGEFYQTRIWIS